MEDSIGEGGEELVMEASVGEGEELGKEGSTRKAWRIVLGREGKK